MWARMWAFSITGDRVIACKLLQISGEPSRTRTCDPLVKSQLLYRLSYRPTLKNPGRISLRFQVSSFKFALSCELSARTSKIVGAVYLLLPSESSAFFASFAPSRENPSHD